MQNTIMFGLLDEIGNNNEFQEARNVNDLFQPEHTKNQMPVPILSSESVIPKHTKTSSYQKSKWTPEEDAMLRKAVEIHGVKNWTAVASLVLKRNPKQCRERWISQIDPSLIRDDWTEKEDQQIIELQQRYGNLWTKISQFIPGRSSNAIKNRYNWLMRRNMQINSFNLIKSMEKMRVFSPQSQPTRQSMPMPLLTRSCESSLNTFDSVNDDEFGQISNEDFDSTWEDPSSSFDFDETFTWS